MGRRRFEHLVLELSLALGRVAPRYALWLRLRELGSDPEDLAREDAISFCDEELHAFLAEMGWFLPSRAARRLRRSVARFDPRYPTPYERMERLGQPRS